MGLMRAPASARRLPSVRACSPTASRRGRGAAEQQPGGTVRLTRAQAAKVLCLRSDLSLKDELSDFLIDEEEEVASEAKPV